MIWCESKGSKSICAERTSDRLWLNEHSRPTGIRDAFPVGLARNSVIGPLPATGSHLDRESLALSLTANVTANLRDDCRQLPAVMESRCPGSSTSPIGSPRRQSSAGQTSANRRTGQDRGADIKGRTTKRSFRRSATRRRVRPWLATRSGLSRQSLAASLL